MQNERHTIKYDILQRDRTGLAHKLVAILSLGILGIEKQTVQTKEVNIIHGGIPLHDVEIPLEGRESIIFERKRVVFHLWGLTAPKK